MRQEFYDDRALQIMECAEEGMPLPEIRGRLGLCDQTIKKYAKSYGIPIRSLNDVRADQLVSLAAQGKTRTEAAKELGVSYQVVVRIAIDRDIAFTHASKNTGVPDRAEDMATMYRAGKTLAQIGTLYGVTRERVRQIMTKHIGTRREDGGRAVSAKINKIRAAAKKEAACLEKYGCSVAERRKILRVNAQMRGQGIGRYRSPTYAYSSQRFNAKRRGIDWNLTLIEWWSIWESSGKWNERGRGYGYMMCRFGDVGAYEAGNVYIATGVHNGKVQPNNPYRTSHPDHDKVSYSLGKVVTRRRPKGRKRVNVGLPTGVFVRGKKFCAKAILNKKAKHLGTFKTPEEAHQAYLAAISLPQPHPSEAVQQ